MKNLFIIIPLLASTSVGALEIVPKAGLPSAQINYLTGIYQYELDRSLAIGYQFLSSITPGPEKTVIFDIDDTLLDLQSALLFQPYETIVAQFPRLTCATFLPRLDPVYRFYEFVRQCGFTIILITGRYEDCRVITEQNLAAAGYCGYRELILRSDSYQQEHYTFYKQQMRNLVLSQGFIIVAAVGDHWADVLGPEVGLAIKLPNDLY